jgi:hypothetical protein
MLSDRNRGAFTMKALQVLFPIPFQLLPLQSRTDPNIVFSVRK